MSGVLARKSKSRNKPTETMRRNRMKRDWSAASGAARKSRNRTETPKSRNRMEDKRD